MGIPYRILALLLLTWEASAQEANALIAGDSSFIGAPGVKARLTLSGVTAVAKMVAKTLASEIAQADHIVTSPAVKLGQTQMMANSPRLKLFNDVNQVTVDMVPIGALTAHITNVNASVPFDVSGTFNGMPVSGEFELLSSGFGMDVTLSIKRNPRGNPLITILSCRAIPPRAPLIVHGSATARNDLVTQLQITLQQTANFDLMQAMIDADKEIRRKARSRSRRAPAPGTLQAFISSNFNLSRAEGLVLDYGVVTSPTLSARGIEMDSSGEISAHNAPTPFGPRPIALSPVVGNEMFEIVVSDFVPNSFMYHGHRIGMFNTRVDPTTPHFGPTMRTTCDLNSGSLFCVGDLFPTLRDQFPDKELVFLFSTLKAPAVIVHKENDGGIAFDLLGLIRVQQYDPVTKKETPIGEMEIQITAQMKMRITSKVVKGKVLLDNIFLRTRTPSVLVQEELDDASLLSREILQRMVNDIIKQGVPIPVHPLFRLKKPTMRLGDRSLILETSFTLNRRLINQLTAAHLSSA
ncbi:unnamed protein product, partial [Mesorhabditis spiculigera]